MVFVHRVLYAALVGVLAAGPAGAADLTVEVTGIRSDRGEIGCALYAGERGFPTDAKAAQQDWHPARQPTVTCRFGNLAPGVYAVAVSHDLNGNRRTDSNLIGIPTEDWGVSNNVRPSMRAPRFSEAAFRIPEQGTARIVVSVGP